MSNVATQLNQSSALTSGGMTRIGANEWRKFYVYPILAAAVPALAAGVPGTGAQVIQIQQDAPFFFLQLTGVVRNNATQALIADPPVRLLLTDGGSNMPLFNSYLDWDQLVGTAELPYVLPVPYGFSANSTIILNVQNYGAVISDVSLALGGYKPYASGAVR